MQVIPSLDLQSGRSRLVWWPGAASGTGTPTDRPERICRWFVEQGAPLVHLVDLDGAAQGRPANITAIQEVARAVAVPLQLAGGVDGPEQIELAFAAGATRVVMPLWAVAEDPGLLRQSLTIAGDWLAIGLDARPERLREYPWAHRAPPSLAELVRELAGAGVHRFVLSHGGAAPDLGVLATLSGSVDAELVVAGGVASPALLPGLRDAGISGVILGEAIFNGAVDYPLALAAAA
ncbi:MAG: phosphoribosylformimino-5-aminoimidazole carboxamide ribotide isomerase [Chloroflexota bacterium]|jgi:phosphoribosylformimino-5-aminoimidazole carboxamide ribotide isomerase|nr:phosphoribosylformimino-5-aminoimidazole carboxamide ribotide isomerase [Chloroflexota bacterium]